MFFDGTWNRRDQVHQTNVAKLATAVVDTRETSDPSALDQRVRYQPGVGTALGERLIGGVFGYGLSRGICEAYQWLANHYKPGCDIYLFGYSRGAYMARSTAGLIRNCGILVPPEHDDTKQTALRRRADEAFALYRSDEGPDGPDAVDFRDARSRWPVPIHLVGVWDTVGALGVPPTGLPWADSWNRRWHFHDTALSSSVRHAYQALAADEERTSYRPTMWAGEGRADHQHVEQVWFAGDHGDVGGGHPHSGTSDIALLWMAERAEEAGLHLRPDWQDHVVPPLAPDALAPIGVPPTGLRSVLPRAPRTYGTDPAAPESLSESVTLRRKNLRNYEPRFRPHEEHGEDDQHGGREQPAGTSRTEIVLPTAASTEDLDVAGRWPADQLAPPRSRSLKEKAAQVLHLVTTHRLGRHLVLGTTTVATVTLLAAAALVLASPNQQTGDTVDDLLTLGPVHLGPFAFGPIQLEDVPVQQVEVGSADVDVVPVLLLAAGLLALLVAMRESARPWRFARGSVPYPHPGPTRWVALVAGSGGLVVAAWRWWPDALPAALMAPALVVTLWTGGYGLHRLRLLRLARLPGPMVLAPVTDATTEREAPLEELAVRMRLALARVDLYSQTLVPGGAAPQDFVELVAGGSSRGWVGYVVGWIRAVSPSHAYTVHWSVLDRDASATDRHGVAVQLLAHPRHLTSPVLHWGETWDEAITRAAHGLAQELLPWTRRGQQPPWMEWTDTRMHADLLHDFHHARALVELQRYEESLLALRDLLSRDPANLHVRLAAGESYEKLGLHRQALETYVAVEELAERRLVDLPMTAARHRRAWALRSSAERARRGAEYRQTLALARSDDLVAAWEQDRRRDSESSASWSDLFRRLGLAAFVDGSSCDPTRLHLELRRRAVHKARDHLVTEPIAARDWRRETGLRETTWTLVQIWTEARYEMATWETRERQASRYRRELLRRTLVQRTSRVCDQRILHWLDHYNAACLFALGYQLSTTGPPPRVGARPPSAATLPKPESVADEMAEKCVDHLRSAMRRVGPDQLRLLRPWLLAEDPDLEPVRATAQFRRLLARQFPGAERTSPRRGYPHRRDAAVQASNLLTWSAEQLADHWASRAEHEPPSLRAMDVVRHQERDWRKALRVLSHGWHDWEVRARCAHAMSSLASGSESGLGPPPDLTVVQADKDVGASAMRPDLIVERLAAVHAAVDVVLWPAEEALIACRDRGRVPGRVAWRRACLAQATLWRAVGEVLADVGSDPGTGTRSAAALAARAWDDAIGGSD